MGTDNRPLADHHGRASPLWIVAAILDKRKPDYPDDGGFVPAANVEDVERLLALAVEQAEKLRHQYADNDPHHLERIEMYKALLGKERQNWVIKNK